jgi:hypothetical protein
LSCRTFAANAVRLQLHALAYNLGTFLRTFATSEPIQDWTLTSLKEKLIKIGAKVVRHGFRPNIAAKTGAVARGHSRRQRRTALRASLRKMINDDVGFRDLPQGLPVMTFLSGGLVAGALAEAPDCTGVRFGAL